MAAIQVEIPPICEPVGLAVAKSHLRVTIPDDDDLISLYLQAAREKVEIFLARSLINKGYRQSLDSFPYFTDSIMSQMAYPPAYYSLPRYSTTLWNYSQMMKLFYSPLAQVTKISYLDSGTQEWLDLLPAPFNWEPDTEYAIGDQREDSNGNLQEVVEAAGDCLSGESAPSAWATESGQTTNDDALVWECKGTAPAGDFVYDADSEPPRVFPMPGQFWPSVLYVPNAVQVHFIAGYGTSPKNVPGLAKIGILQTLASWYENRESVSPADLKEVPGHVQDALWSLRVLDFAATRG